MAAQIRSLPSRYSIVMTVVLALIAMFAINASFSDAEGLPANKVAAAGSDLDVIEPDNGEYLVMSETMKVSTTRDLMLHLSAECSILTRLNTSGAVGDNGAETDFAFGQVKMSIAIDGKRVPVALDDTGAAPDADGQGEVVFCNRAYQRSVSDAENDDDGVDAENDYIRTRSANAFTWLALNAGDVYDDPANGNNVIQVDVFAEYTTTASEAGAPVVQSCGEGNDEAAPLEPGGPTCADAFVGSRTLVVDTDVAANDETVQEKDEPTAYVRS